MTHKVIFYEQIWHFHFTPWLSSKNWIILIFLIAFWPLQITTPPAPNLNASDYATCVHFTKGFPRLALMDSDKWDKSAHVKCYICQKWTNELWYLLPHFCMAVLFRVNLFPSFTSFCVKIFSPIIDPMNKTVLCDVVI